MKECEEEFFGNQENPLFAWNGASIEKAFKDRNFEVKAAGKTITEKRRITETEINRWFDCENSSYGSAMEKGIGSEDLKKIKNLLISASQNRLFNWCTTIEFLTVSVVK